MEFDLIPQLIIIFSAGIIVFILGKNILKIKRIPNDNSLFENNTTKTEREKFFYLYKRLVRRINKEEYQKKINLFWIWLEKTLRKLRISFLKLDNKIVSLLDELREKKIEHIDREGQGESNGIKLNKIAGNDKNREGGKVTFVGTNKTGDTGNVKSPMVDSKKKDSDENIKKRSKDDKEQEYINLILKNPDDIKLYWKLGIIYSRKKNYKDAISCFRQIIKIDPTYAKAKKKVADLIKRMRKRNDKNESKKDRIETEKIQDAGDKKEKGNAQ